MKTETYQDAIDILRAEAYKMQEIENSQLMVDTLLLTAGFLEKCREEIAQEKDAATLPDEGNK